MIDQNNLHNQSREAHKVNFRYRKKILTQSLASNLNNN